MKLQKILFAIFISILFGCSEKNNEVIITVKTIGKTPGEILYTVPVNGNCNWHFKESVKPDSFGDFLISTTIYKPSFIQLFINGLEDYLTLIIEPGRNYELIFDLNSKEKVFKINSNLGKLQDYYNSLSKINPRSCLYSFNNDISNISEIKQDLNENKQKEISVFKEFYQNGDISEDLFELLKLDREVYYSTAQGVLASINNLTISREGIVVPDEIFDTWGEAVLSIPLTNPNILRANFVYDYLDMYFWYKVYTTLNVEKFIKTRSEFRKQGLSHTYTIDLAKGFFTDDILEFYIVEYIFFQLSLKIHEKEFISIMAQFKLDYPNSVYTQYLESPINKILKLNK